VLIQGVREDSPENAGGRGKRNEENVWKAKTSLDFHTRGDGRLRQGKGLQLAAFAISWTEGEDSAKPPKTMEAVLLS